MDTINNNNNIINSADESASTIKKVNRLEKISSLVLLIGLVLAPIAFIPSSYSSLDMVKTLVISFSVLISGILYFISSFKNREISFPKNKIVFAGIAVIVSLLVSTFASTHFAKSLFGQGFEVGTTSFILVLFLGSLVTIYLTNKDKERVVYIYSAIIVSFIILALFHISRMIFGADFMDFNIFRNSTASLIGKWNDFGIMAGLMLIISYLSINFLSLNKIFKVLLSILSLFCIFVLIVVNIPVLWFMLAVVIAGITAYQYSISEKGNDAGKIKRFFSKLPKISMVIVIIALLFTFKGGVIANSLIKKTNLYPNEIIFPWQLTLDVATDTIKESPLFGAGPNRFGFQYLKYKPLEVNATPFFETEFNQGFGLIPTFFVTQGLVGGILWIVFFILFIKTGIEQLKKKKDNLSQFFTVSSYFTAGFLWMMNLVSYPSHALLFISFVLLGVFISATDPEKYMPSQKKIILPVTLIILLICVAWVSIYAKKTMALSYFQSGIRDLQLPENQGLERAERNFNRALFLDENDIYYQALSEITIVKINKLTQEAQNAGTTIDQATIDKVQKLVDEAIQYTRQAEALDPTNYYNHIAESRVSELALILGINNAYENIKTNYTNAIALNRYNPALYLNLARIESARGNYADAQVLIGNALQLKQNYIDAIFLLSQIQVAQGKINDAITSVKVASQINPSSPLIFFQLGLLYYNAKDFENAITSLTRAVELDNQYANAQYFLGLSYARLGEIDKAIPYFEALTVTNPDNEEVKLILGNLKVGRSPFAQAQPPIDNKPEQRKTLPIKEKTDR